MPDDPPIELSDPKESTSEQELSGQILLEELAKMLAEEWVEATQE